MTDYRDDQMNNSNIFIAQFFAHVPIAAYLLYSQWMTDSQDGTVPVYFDEQEAPVLDFGAEEWSGAAVVREQRKIWRICALIN